MKIAPLADVKARLSSFLDHAEEVGPVVITRNGKPAAVLIAPRDDDDLESMVLGRSPKFLAMLAQADADVKAGRTIPAQEFWKRVKKQADAAETTQKRKRRAKA